MKTKICKKCGQEKSDEEFQKGRNSCKSCMKEHLKEWRRNNKKRIKEYKEKYYNEHKNEILKYAKEKSKQYYNAHKEDEELKIKRKKYAKEYRQNNKEKRKKYVEKNKEKINEQIKRYKIKNRVNQNKKCRERRKADEIYKLKIATRNMINNSFKRNGHTKKEKAEKLLGCDLDYFIKYLLETYKNNYNEEYNVNIKVHIDHIIPISKAQTREDVIKMCNYTNLQLLKAKDNLNKSNKLDWKLVKE